MFEILPVALGSRRLRPRARQVSIDPAHLGPRTLDRASVQAAKGVEQVAVTPGVEQTAIIVLTMNFDDQAANLPDQPGRNGGCTHEGAAPAVALQSAPDDQRLARVRLDALFPEEAVRGMVGGKLDLCGDHGLLLARTDEPAVGAASEREPERVQQDRLARSGLPGEHAQPWLELQFEPLDQHNVVDSELLQHATRSRRPRLTSARLPAWGASSHSRAGAAATGGTRRCQDNSYRGQPPSCTPLPAYR